jgi:hypothetical protein
MQVYKSGSFGRLLDITKFSSYEELRIELGRLFGIEGQLKADPLRSGWQLVFVDRENDILLVGDDPWQYASLPPPLPPFTCFVKVMDNISMYIYTHFLQGIC